MDQRPDAALLARERLEMARAAHLGIAPRPMCVLQVVPAMETGGVERTTVDVAAALIAEDDRALVVSSGGRLVADLEAAGATHFTLPAASKNILKMRANAGAIAALVEEEGVDIIHARSRAPAWSALWAAAWTNRPLVTTYHGAYSEGSAFKNRYNSVMARGDIVIANSSYTAGLIAARHPFAKERIVTIPRGTDLSMFGKPAEPRAPEMLKRWGVEPNVPVILHMGRLTPWKGQEVVIDALATLKTTFPRAFVCVFAGDDQGRTEYSGRLKAQVRRHGLEEHVRFAGHVSDVPAAFAAATVAVMPSIEPEAFGRVAVEAQGAGVPVIVSDHGAVRETVLAPPEVPRDRRTGWRVPVGDVPALADALFWALQTSRDGLAEIGKRGRAHALANFSLDAMTHKTLKIYHSLLDQRVSSLY